MSGPDPKAEVTQLLAPSVESIIAEGLNEDFPDGQECRVTHLPLDVDTLQAICCMNLPKAFVSRDEDDIMMDFTDHGVTQILFLSCVRKDSFGPGDSIYWMKLTVTQCNSYVNAIKAMKEMILNTDNQYGPMKNNKLGNYGLESADASRIIWARFTTVVEFGISDNNCNDCTSPWIDSGRIAAALDKAMKEHEGSVSAVPKSTLIYNPHMPERFPIGESIPLKFPAAWGAHSDREFELGKESELEHAKAFVEVNGGTKTTKGRFDTGFSVTFQKKAKVKLVIRTAHKSSLWPSEHVYVLKS